MPGWTAALRRILRGVFGLGAVAALGCQSLVGIEDRRLAEDQHCAEYCDLVTSTCQGEQAVYTLEDTCMGVCRLLPAGEPAEPTGNTVACRTRQLRANQAEVNVACRLGGPGGGRECGSDCESYCRILSGACPSKVVDLSLTECTRRCGALRRETEFNVSAEYQQGDTLECRLYHVSAATTNPETHCPHSVIAPLGDAQPCSDPASAAPNCADYCRVIGVACTGSRKEYESEKQCLSACSALAPGTNADTSENTVGCRKYHSYNSLEGPDVHCPHAGPTGNGHCGDSETGICEAYCRLAEKACPQAYAAHFGSDPSACQAECSGLTGVTESSAEELELEFSIAHGEQGGNTATCRTLHALRAFDNADECAAALGAAPCTE